MRGQCLGLLVGAAVTFTLLTTTVTGQEESDGSAALELLQKKGLRKLSSHFAFADEADVGRAIRAAELLRKKVAEAQREVNASEQKVEEKRKTILGYLQKRRELRSQLSMARTVDAKNNLINTMNELGDRVNLLQGSDQEEETVKTVRAAATKVGEEYVEHLLKTRKLFDKIQDQYEQLAADEEVAKAISAYSKASSRQFQLGPAPSFTAYGRKLKSLEDIVLSEAIDIRRGPDSLWYLPVVFNGKHAIEMAVDTGASLIVLPAKMATAAGLTPSSDAPTIQCKLADGSIVEAKLVQVASVRIGKFTVENVECAVMPSSLAEASPLLGQSFFKHFSFKIDGERSKLVMSKIEMPEKETGRGRGRK